MTNNTQLVHELRIQTVPFEDLLSGVKTGEVRNSDRGFKVGDSVLLNEVSGTFPVPTGRQMRRKITHIQTGYGLPDGIVVLSYAPAEDVRAVVEEPVAWMSECIRGYKKGVIQQTDGPGSTNNIEYWTPDFPVYRRPQRPVANLKRYDWARDDGMVEDATGEYVLWSDLERLNK